MENIRDNRTPDEWFSIRLDKFYVYLELFKIYMKNCSNNKKNPFPQYIILSQKKYGPLDFDFSARFPSVLIFSVTA